MNGDAEWEEGDDDDGDCDGAVVVMRVRGRKAERRESGKVNLFSPSKTASGTRFVPSSRVQANVI